MTTLARNARTAGAQLLGLLAVLAGAGCQQMAAAQAANTAAQVAGNAAQTAGNAAQSVMRGAQQIAEAAVPTNILAQAAQTLSSNNLNWGHPQAIYTADQMYVFVYATRGSLFSKSQSRVLVIDAMGRTARLQKLAAEGK